MYLISSESFRLMEEEINKIIKEEKNKITMDLSVSSLQDVITEATYVSMFEERKYIIVKNADFFTSRKSKEEDLELLLSYMENPIPLTTIIFTTYEKIDLRKKVTKIFKEKYKIISIGDVSYNDLMSKVRDYVFKHEYKIDTETIHYLISCCQNNYDLIYNEIQKIFLYYMEPQMIKLEDVKSIVSKSLEENHFRFVEAVIAKDLKKALLILEDLYTLKVDPIALVMLLAREYRLMYSVKILMSEGYSKGMVSKNLSLQDWQVDKLSRNSSNYYLDDISIYLKKIATIDFEIKSGEVDKFIAMKELLLNLV